MTQIDEREIAEQRFAYPCRFLVCPARHNRAAHDPRPALECGVSVQQFFGPGRASACVVNEGDYAAKCSKCCRGAYVARIRKSRLRFDKLYGSPEISGHECV